jgi:predicted nucleotidyltransferase
MSRRLDQRRAIAEEAARLMVEEDVTEYISAKQIAADNVCGMRVGSNVPLPSNGEIRAAIVARATLVEGVRRGERLRHLRHVALEVMGQLAAFEPRLIGSVATGAIHRNSDVDIQVFCADHAPLEWTLRACGHDAERLEHEVARDGRFHRYIHYHFDLRDTDVELSVYPPEELRTVRLSSIDGKPIDRVPRRRLEALIRTTSS